MKKRILFLISDTGGGHRASAQAIAEAIRFLHPARYELIIEDLWKNHTPRPFCKLPNTYRWMTGPGLPLWKLLWATLAQPTLQRRILTDIGFWVRADIIAYYRAHRPDLIVSIHPLLNRIGLDCLHTAQLDIPFVTVVTDLVTFHPTWIDPRVTRCMVPTEAARQRALVLGMAPEKLAVYGQPVSLQFAQPVADKAALRQKLGLAKTRPTVLLTGGGEGGGQMFAIARAIAQQATQSQLMIVTGRNTALRAALNAIPWEIPTQIYGFVDNMPELMHAADLLVTKAGPGTISEALIAGLPMILSDYIPGQETGNVHFVESNGVGRYAKEPAAIAEMVQEWSTHGKRALATMARNAARLARPRAALLIAEDLCYLLEHGRPSTSLETATLTKAPPTAVMALPQFAPALEHEQ
jgi:1,2-diacylglycerol 3-beta-galactosyltransferase